MKKVLFLKLLLRTAIKEIIGPVQGQITQSLSQFIGTHTAILEENGTVSFEQTLVDSVADLRWNCSEKAARARVGGAGLCFGDLNDCTGRHLGSAVEKARQVEMTSQAIDVGRRL